MWHSIMTHLIFDDLEDAFSFFVAELVFDKVKRPRAFFGGVAPVGGVNAVFGGFGGRGNVEDFDSKVVK